MLDASVRHVFYHPNHDPTPKAGPALDLKSDLPRFLMYYDVLARGMGIQRRWLDVHPSAEGEPTERIADAQVIATVATFAAELEQRGKQFGNVSDAQLTESSRPRSTTNPGATPEDTDPSFA